MSEDKAVKISEDVDGLLAEITKSIAFEELGETISLLVEGLEEPEEEFQRKLYSTVHDLRSWTVENVFASSKRNYQQDAAEREVGDFPCFADDESSDVLQNSDVELKERLELVEKELREVAIRDEEDTGRRA